MKRKEEQQEKEVVAKGECDGAVVSGFDQTELRSLWAR